MAEAAIVEEAEQPGMLRRPTGRRSNEADAAKKVERGVLLDKQLNLPARIRGTSGGLEMCCIMSTL